jgi:hypothetical protein
MVVEPTQSSDQGALTPLEAQALSDVQQWLAATKNDVADYYRYSGQLVGLIPVLALGGKTTDDQRAILLGHTNTVDRLLSDAHQFHKASRRSSLPREVRKRLAKSAPTELVLPVKHLRNMRVHWEDCRRYFEKPGMPVPADQSSVIWYKNHYPDMTPWASGWSNSEGHRIGGILDLAGLEAALREAAGIVGEYDY